MFVSIRSHVILGILAAFALGAAVLAQTPPQNPASVPSNNQATPMSVAGQLIGDAKASFARVRDYAGLFYKQERVGGQLLPEQTIQIRVRQQPFSVYMKWVGPQKMAGQEACYVAGKNNNQLRAKSSGPIMGSIGFVSLDPRDPKAMAGNRHAITDSGMGHLIERLDQSFEAERKMPPDQTSFTFGEYRFQQKACTRMEAIHRVNNGQAYAHRIVVYFDHETRLPMRVETYDWPKPGGQPGGDLLECYSYVDLKFNVNLTDAAFNH